MAKKFFYLNNPQQFAKLKLAQVRAMTASAFQHGIRGMPYDFEFQFEVDAYKKGEDSEKVVRGIIGGRDEFA